jgi:hypothetical protein
MLLFSVWIKINYDLKNVILARHQCLMPGILATWKAEKTRITVQSQPRKIVHKTLSQEYPTQNRVGGVVQVVELLPSKCEVLKFKSQYC